MGKMQVVEITPHGSNQKQPPYAFDVSGPRNVPSIHFFDLICSTWKNDGNYKRTVIACFVQAVYVLEHDRREKRTDKDDAVAPEWWTPFKYKLVETLIDQRDGSIFGAIFKWDRSAALSSFGIRPSGAPKAVLALRGTLLKGPTIIRDFGDDLRFFTWETLEGSVRFASTLKALKRISGKYGSTNVCIAGHSLGAGFALQVGKSLVQEGIFVEAHLFNPPSVSLALGLKTLVEKASIMLKKIVRSIMFTSSSANSSSDSDGRGESSTMLGSKGWSPNLYVNNSDYICCHYIDPEKPKNRDGDKENVKAGTMNNCAAKLFVFSKEKQKFIEAHGLEQWWSDDNFGIKEFVNKSKLICTQLK
ncbi:hypothetical protein ABFX02_13G049700 [Erythranthe guttata]